MQMFLEYQSVSGSGLRRMMDAPIVSTSRCHLLATAADADSSQEIATVCTSTLHRNEWSCALCRNRAAVKASSAGVTLCLGLQLRTLEQCKLVATVCCLTHKHVTVSVSWLVSRVSDDAVRMDPTMVTERRRRDTSQQRLFPEGVVKNGASSLKPLQRMGTLHSDPGLSVSAHGASSRITESFIGAGTLSTALNIGTAAGSQTCSLHGVFLHSGQYDVSLQIESVKDAASGLILSVHDYAVCHPLQLQVEAPNGV